MTRRLFNILWETKGRDKIIKIKQNNAIVPKTVLNIILGWLQLMKQG